MRATAMRSSNPYRLALDVGDRDVHGPAAAALDAHLERHLRLAHRRREQVAAARAHVIVRAVGAEHRAVGVLLDRGAAVGGHLARAHLPHRDPRHQSLESLPVKSWISASSTPATTPSPIDAALPVICAWVCSVPPPLARLNSAVAFAWPCPPASRDLTVITARWTPASFSVISTVPMNFSDIAPMRTTISAFTESSPSFSSTLPPSTHGTTCSRSVSLAKFSSVEPDIVNEWSRSTAIGSPSSVWIGCARAVRTGARQWHPRGADGADGDGGEGGPRPAHPRHRMARNAGARRRARGDPRRRRHVAEGARGQRRHEGARRRRSREHRADDRR